MTSAKSGRKMTAKEASALLVEHGYDVSPVVIRLLCKQRRLPGATKIGKTWFIPREAVEQLMG
jgi:hypothetical protein